MHRCELEHCVSKRNSIWWYYSIVNIHCECIVILKKKEEIIIVFYNM